jgi:hypothetical protein
MTPSKFSTLTQRLGIATLLLVPLWGCGNAEAPPVQPNSQANPPAIVRDQAQAPAQKLQDGQYPLQQASYDDGSGDYTLMLLNTPAGMDAAVQLSEVKMARLTDEQIKAGEKSYVKVENGEPTLYLTEDFKIEYTHNVTEVQTNPQTGNRETVVVRRESSFWSPFFGSLAGNIAGQAIGNMLFRPQYYMPPRYDRGGLFGYGGYGNRYDDAIGQYRSRYNEPPMVERNRTNFRTTGQLRNTPSQFGSRVTRPIGGTTAVKTTPSATPKATFNQNEPRRSTGSGFGSSDLRRTGKTYKSPSIGNQRRSTGFGSSGGSRIRSGGKRR